MSRRSAPSSSAIPGEVLDLANRAFGPTTTRHREGPQTIAPLPGLLLLKHHVPTDFEATIYKPVVCLILQGSKQTSLGERTFEMHRGECLLVSHDLPVVSRIIKAPYMALLVDIDVNTLRGLYDDLGASPHDVADAHALEVHRASPKVIDALGRYLSLIESPTDAQVLGPALSREIHYRLMMAPVCGMLRSLIRYDSHAALVARAIERIRRDFRSSLVVADVAREVGMSVSSFHRHFKAVTSLSPLQYQKELRLLEGRRLLLAGASSVSTTAFEVGYESLSQFSREYSRKFGKSPNRDLAGPSSHRAR